MHWKPGLRCVWWKFGLFNFFVVFCFVSLFVCIFCLFVLCCFLLCCLFVCLFVCLFRMRNKSQVFFCLRDIFVCWDASKMGTHPIRLMDLNILQIWHGSKHPNSDYIQHLNPSELVHHLLFSRSFRWNLHLGTLESAIYQIPINLKRLSSFKKPADFIGKKCKKNHSLWKYIFVIVYDGFFRNGFRGTDLIFSKPKSVLWSRRLTIPCRSLTVRNLKSYRNPIPFFRGNVELEGVLYFWDPLCEFTFSDWLKVKGVLLSNRMAGKCTICRWTSYWKWLEFYQLTKFTQKVGLTV